MGRLLLIIVILWISIYMYSFARYNWQQQNRIAVVGVVLLTLVAIILPIIVLW
jgi:uncharacterized membrane protein (UPF0182 family)